MSENNLKYDNFIKIKKIFKKNCPFYLTQNFKYIFKDSFRTIKTLTWLLELLHHLRTFRGKISWFDHHVCDNSVL